MSYIFFKLKSAQGFDRLEIEGGKLKVLEVKMQIADKLKMDSKDYDLVLTHFQTEQVYTDDFEFITQGTSITVTRKPVEKASKAKPNFIRERERTERVKEDKEDMSRVLNTAPVGDANLTSHLVVPTNDEDKVKQLRNDEDTRYYMNRFEGKGAGKSLLNRGAFGGKGAKGGGKGGEGAETPKPQEMTMQKQFCQTMLNPPPPNQACSYCRSCGHWPSQCPNKILQPKRSLVHPRAVPAAMLEVCSADDADAKYQHQSTGVIYKVKPNEQQFRSLREGDIKDKVPRADVPDDLQCPLCSELFTEAVLVSCCGETYCSACLETYLEGNKNICPGEGCDETVSSQMMISAKTLRDMCRDFRMKYEAKARQSRVDADKNAKVQKAEQRERERKEKVMEKAKEKEAVLQHTAKQVFDPSSLAQLEQKNAVSANTDQTPVHLEPAATPLHHMQQQHPVSLQPALQPLQPFRVQPEPPMSRDQFEAAQRKALHLRMLQQQAGGVVMPLSIPTPMPSVAPVSHAPPVDVPAPMGGLPDVAAPNVNFNNMQMPLFNAMAVAQQLRESLIKAQEMQGNPAPLNPLNPLQGTSIINHNSGHNPRPHHDRRHHDRDRRGLRPHGPHGERDHRDRDHDKNHQRDVRDRDGARGNDPRSQRRGFNSREKEDRRDEKRGFRPTRDESNVSRHRSQYDRDRNDRDSGRGDRDRRERDRRSDREDRHDRDKHEERERDHNRKDKHDKKDKKDKKEKKERKEKKDKKERRNSRDGSAGAVPIAE